MKIRPSKHDRNQGARPNAIPQTGFQAAVNEYRAYANDRKAYIAETPMPEQFSSYLLKRPSSRPIRTHLLDWITRHSGTPREAEARAQVRAYADKLRAEGYGKR